MEVGIVYNICVVRVFDVVKRIKLMVNILIYENNKYDIVKNVKIEKC